MNDFISKYRIQGVIIGYFLVLSLIYILINKILFPGLFTSSNFLQFDAKLYQDISSNGYKGFNVAFFPLFPKLWGITGFGVYGILVLNFVVYIGSMMWLSKIFNFTNLQLIFFLAIPATIFYYLPYSESWFFLGGTVILISLKQKKFKLLYIGLFICTLSRPAYTILFPALIFLEFFSVDKLKVKLSRLGKYALILILTTFLVALIQFMDTGEWFKFFEAQSQWGNELGLPSFPLRSWSEIVIIRYDAIVFLIGVISGLYLLSLLYKRFKKKEVDVPHYILFSLLYVAGISFVVLLFRGGSMFSLNRFVLSTPFFIIVFYHFLTIRIKLDLKKILLFFVLTVAFWMMFGAYLHIQVLIPYLMLSLFCVLVLLIKSSKDSLSKFSSRLTLLILIVFQCFLMMRYLDGLWIA